MTTYAPIRIDLAGFARDGLGDHAALITLAQQADRLGFGGIWFNEFHFARDRLPHLSTLLLGAAILAVTERLRFGTSILMLPLLYSPEPNEQRQFAPYCAALDRHGQGTAPLQASSLSRNVCIHKDRATALAQLDSQTRHLNEGRAARARAAGNPAQRMDHIAPWKVAAPCVDRQRPGPVGGGALFRAASMSPRSCGRPFCGCTSDAVVKPPCESYQPAGVSAATGVFSPISERPNVAAGQGSVGGFIYRFTIHTETIMYPQPSQAIRSTRQKLTLTCRSH